MFTQRKSFFKGKLFYIILFVLFAFGLWLNQPIAERAPEGLKTGSDYSGSDDTTGKQDDKGKKDNYNILDSIIDNNQAAPASQGAVVPEITVNESDSPGHEDGYYLIKEVKGKINIFYYNNEGKESFIRETDIAFSLLSVADQTLFRKGVIRHSPEELDELLQDFES